MKLTITGGTKAAVGLTGLRQGSTANQLRALGLAVVAFSALYLATDLVEAAQGGFTTAQLTLTLIAEAAVPVLILGLYAAQRPHIGSLGLAGAAGYAYSYVFFAGSVVYALVNSTPDFEALSDELGIWMTLHGGLMLLGGLAFGAAVIRAGVLPAGTGALLIMGVILVVATSGQTQAVETGAASVRAVAFVAMGAALVIERGKA
jgi:hypothetical protein